MTTHEVLKKLEWQESELGPRCPLCRAYQPRGHREGCEMQAALERLVNDWEATAKALLVKYGGVEGTEDLQLGMALVGDMTLAWAKKHVLVDVLRQPGSFLLQWRAPPLKFPGT